MNIGYDYSNVLISKNSNNKISQLFNLNYQKIYC